MSAACKKDKPQPVDNKPTITALSTTDGFPGTEVSIAGTNFSADKAQNTVKFGTVAVTEIISATTTELKVKVPAGAVTGKISVTVNGQTVESSQPFNIISLKFSKNFGGSSEDYFNKVIPSADGGFVAVGSTRSSDGDVPTVGTKGSGDALVVKMDASGNIVWKKVFGGTDPDSFFGITSTDGGFIAVGQSFSYNGDLAGITTKGFSDALAVKMDANTGNIVWKTVFGGSSYDTFRDVISTTGGCVMVGETSSSDQDIAGLSKGGSDALVVKIDANTGNIVWKKVFGGTSSDSFEAIVTTTGGGFVAVGETYSNNGDISGTKGRIDGWIVKLNASGEKIWSKNFGGTNDDFFIASGPGANGSFIAVGYTFSNNNGDIGANKGKYDAWLLRIGY